MPSQSASSQSQTASRRRSACQLARRLGRLFNVMESRPPFQHARRIVLSMPVLFHACISYEIDMERWKPFHRISIPDRHKRAAFMFKWLTKTQPVKLLSSIGTQAAPWELGANSYFAILGALGELKVDVYLFAKSPEAKAIYYTGIYRDVSPDSWAITFCLLEKAYPLR